MTEEGICQRCGESQDEKRPSAICWNCGASLSSMKIITDCDHEPVRPYICNKCGKEVGEILDLEQEKTKKGAPRGDSIP